MRATYPGPCGAKRWPLPLAGPRDTGTGRAEALRMVPASSRSAMDLARAKGPLAPWRREPVKGAARPCREDVVLDDGALRAAAGRGVRVALRAGALVDIDRLASPVGVSLRCLWRMVGGRGGSRQARRGSTISRNTRLVCRGRFTSPSRCSRARGCETLVRLTPRRSARSLGARAPSHGRCMSSWRVGLATAAKKAAWMA